MGERLEDMLARLEEAERVAGRKRAELQSAIESGLVSDPITGTIFTIAFLKAVLISTAISVGTSLLSRALTPRQKLETGRMSGELLIQRSEQGLFIPEVYGGNPINYATTWTATTAFALGAWIKPPTYNGYFYVVTVAGTTGGSQPTWGTTVDGTFTNGTVTFRTEQAGGGVRIGPLIVYSSSIRKHVTTTRGGGGGGKGPKAPETTETSYDIDLGLMWGRGPLDLSRMYANTEILLDVAPSSTQTGILDPTQLPDTGYDQDFPPDPKSTYNLPMLRYDGDLVTDGTGVKTGVVSSGSNANIAIYPGNQTQLEDPTIEADIDARYGAGSTPAYRGRALTVHKNFYLTKYHGIVPQFNGVWHHQTAKSLDLAYADMSLRSGLLVTDYDYSGINTLPLRGLGIAQRYQPAQLMETLNRLFNVYVFESDKIYARIQGSVASVATIDDSDLGWSEGDDDDTQVLQELDSSIASEIDVPRRIDVRFSDPAKDFEPNLQSEARQITRSERIESIEVQVTMTAAEAREVAARELYQADVEATTHPFSLPWTYLYLNPGDTVTIPRDEGFTHTIRLTSIKQSIGVLECEGVAEETAVYTQPVSTTGGDFFETPPVPIPAMTVIGFYDGPLLRDEENTNNNGSGIYAWAQKRTGSGAWNGAGLYVDRGLGDELIAVFEKEATAGTAATTLANDLETSPFAEYAVAVDLYGTDATLESTDTDGLIAGAGACILGDEVCQILTAERDTSNLVSFPNRWNLIIGIRGQRGTEFATNDHATGERFVLINDAVKFVPLNLNEFNVTRTYHAVTSGQSLDDSAEIEYTWGGGSRKDLSPVNATREDDSVDNSLIGFSDRERLGFGIHNGVSAFGNRDVKRWEIDFLSDSTRTTVVRTVPVVDGMTQAALLESTGASKFLYVDANTLQVTGATNARARSLQKIIAPGNFIEATLSIEAGSLSAAAELGIVPPSVLWKTAGTSELPIRLRLHVMNWGGTDEPTLSLYEAGSGVPVFHLHAADAIGYEERVRFTFSGSEVRIHRNWAGPGTPPLRVFPFVTEFPVYAIGLVEGQATFDTKVMDMFLTTSPEPKTIYSRDQQIEDGLTPGATIYANIYKISPEVGRGYPLEAVLLPG